MERRILPIESFEVRAATGETPAMIRGYAAVFNQLSVVLYRMFREKIAPGAFSETIANDDIRSLWNHNADMVLGRNRNGTLTLREDGTGLFMEVLPPDTQAGRDALISVGRGDVSQQSMMFDVQPYGDEWYEDAEGQIIRTLKRLKLHEVSPVTFPAYPQTTAEARIDDKFEELPTLPRWVEKRLNRNGDLYRMGLRKRRLQLFGQIL